MQTAIPQRVEKCNGRERNGWHQANLLEIRPHQNNCDSVQKEGAQSPTEDGGGMEQLLICVLSYFQYRMENGCILVSHIK